MHRLDSARPATSLRGHQKGIERGGDGDSVAVRAASWQHPQDVNELLIVAREAHAPVADPESPFVVGARQLDDVAGRGIADEAIERLNDPSLYGTIEPSKVATGPRREDPAAARLGAQANSRRISSAEMISPRAISALASATPSSSSGVTGSSSTGALRRSSESPSLPGSRRAR